MRRATKTKMCFALSPKINTWHYISLNVLVCCAGAVGHFSRTTKGQQKLALNHKITVHKVVNNVFTQKTCMLCMVPSVTHGYVKQQVIQTHKNL